MANTETKKYTVHALLRTLSPMHIASAVGGRRMSMDTGRPIYGGKNSAGIAMTAIQTLSVYDSESSSTAEVPVIPANNIAGRLRRHAANEVLGVLVRKNQKVALSTFSALLCGAATGKPDGRDPTFPELRESRAHPYIGLLGGGPRMMRRYVRVHNAVPFMNATRIMFQRNRNPALDNDGHLTTRSPEELTQCWAFRRLDDLDELAGLDLATRTVENIEQELARRQAAVLTDKAKKDGGEDGDRTSTTTFSALQFVLPGIVFPLTFELDVTEAQMGLFLRALDAFAANERIGGHSRNGFGQFSLDDVVITTPEKTVSGVFNQSRLVETNDEVVPWLRAWGNAAAELEAKDLDRLFALPEESKTKKAKATEDATA